MASDFRDAPDDQIIDPDHCGHAVSFLGAGMECGLSLGHVPPHTAYVQAKARRSGLGSLDEVARDACIEWVDQRPPAVVGDVRHAIRKSQERGAELRRRGPKSPADSPS